MKIEDINRVTLLILMWVIIYLTFVFVNIGHKENDLVISKIELHELKKQTENLEIKNAKLYTKFLEKSINAN